MDDSRWPRVGLSARPASYRPAGPGPHSGNVFRIEVLFGCFRGRNGTKLQRVRYGTARWYIRSKARRTRTQFKIDSRRLSSALMGRLRINCGAGRRQISCLVRTIFCRNVCTAIQWITRGHVETGPVGSTIFCRSVTRKISNVSGRSKLWSARIWRAGNGRVSVPDMEIEPGDETTRLIRERGWTYWHHLFNARQLLGVLSKDILRHLNAGASVAQPSDLLVTLCIALRRLKASYQWRSLNHAWAHRGSEREYTAHVFYNQALNTFLELQRQKNVDHISAEHSLRANRPVRRR